MAWTAEFTRAYNRQYYLARREELKARAAERYRANRDRAAARYQERRAEILDRLRRQRLGPDGHIVQAKQRARYARNPAPAIARANKRRARLLGAAVGTDRVAYAAKVADIRTRDTLQCHWCSREVPRSRRHIDHIVPIAKGGVDSAENLCGSCARCNLRKQDRWPSEFVPD